MQNGRGTSSRGKGNVSGKEKERAYIESLMDGTARSLPASPNETDMNHVKVPIEPCLGQNCCLYTRTDVPVASFACFRDHRMSVAGGTVTPSAMYHMYVRCQCRYRQPAHSSPWAHANQSVAW